MTHERERCLHSISRCREGSDSDDGSSIRDQMTQTFPVSFQLNMERFENDIRLITCMAEYRHADALKLVTQILETYSLALEETFKYNILKLECYLNLFMFVEAREEGPRLFDTSCNVLQFSESEISAIAFRCRENRDFVRAMLYYQCALRCFLRDMRMGKIKKRSIEVINRGEKFALAVYHLGLSTDTKGIVYEYGLQVFHSFIKDYESGPEKLNVHRDLTIMGCCYYMGVTLKNLNDPKGALNFTSHGINIGMKSMKEHENHLLAKSHFLTAQCYLLMNEPETAEMWLQVALKLCPFITKWDYQSSTETRKEFEEEVKNFLENIKLSQSTQSKQQESNSPITEN